LLWERKHDWEHAKKVEAQTNPDEYSANSNLIPAKRKAVWVIYLLNYIQASEKLIL
jgi:hypothetical protein